MAQGKDGLAAVTGKMKAEIQKEVESLMKAKVGEDPFARTPALSQEFEDLLNHGIAYHLSAANSADSAAAYFGMDSTGLPGVASFFKVSAAAQRADAWTAIGFLQKRGGRVTFGEVEGPPAASTWHSSTGPDLLVAMVKALAIAKYGLTAVDKMYQVAHKHHDSASVAYALDRAYQDAEAVAVLSKYVAHLKVVAPDKHAMKSFDRELACQVKDKSKAVAIETVAPPHLQMGPVARNIRTKQMCAEGGWLGRDACEYAV